MIHHFVPDDTGRGVRPVLVSVVAEVRYRGMRTGNQYLGNALDRIADSAKEFVLGAHRAAMLPGVVVVASDPLRLQMLGVELQYLSGLVIRPNDSVRMIHG